MESLSCRQKNPKQSLEPRYIQCTLRDFKPFFNIVKSLNVIQRKFRLQHKKEPILSLKTQKQTKLGVIYCLGLKTQQKSGTSHIEG